VFDFAQHGPIESHRYRSWYDAQPGSNTKCSFCGRIIRYCYAMHDQHGKTFLIGSCDFFRYKGTENYRVLKAAAVEQRFLRHNIDSDIKEHGGNAEVQERRKAWSKARRAGQKQVRLWVMNNGTWLPKPLYDLQQAAGKKPRQYKRQSAAARWFEQQTEKIISLTKDSPSI
jgi:hypothetical protein